MTGKKWILSLFSLLFLTTSCSAETNSSPNADTSNEAQTLSVPSLQRFDYLTNLQSPWDLAFLSDGTLFYTERCLGLSVRTSNGRRVRIFGSSGAASVAKDFFCQGQSGMNGVAIDPDFHSNHFIYVYMLSNSGSGDPTNHVVRLKLNSSLTAVIQRTDIITGIPFKTKANTWGDAGLHSGGRIRFGPDGFLYVTTGDNHNGPLPQDLSRLGGKVLRVDRNGAAAPGNNTPTGGDPRIYTYGHRNVQGISFHPLTGRAFTSEHGPGHDDEVTPLTAGGNSGWDPVPDPGVTCADNYCGYISNKADGTPTPMTDTSKFPNAMRPAYDLQDSSGMGPCTFLTGLQWKSWSGALLVGIMGAGQLTVLQFRSETTVSRVSTADLPKARMRSLVEGPDGNLYVATDEGAIWKITPN